MFLRRDLMGFGLIIGLVVGAASSAIAETACANPNVPAKTLSAVTPQTPKEAARLGIHGEALVLVTLGEDSAQIAAPVVMRSPSVLVNAAAIDAARRSRFQTEIRNCETRISRYVFVAEFQDTDGPTARSVVPYVAEIDVRRIPLALMSPFTMSHLDKLPSEPPIPPMPAAAQAPLPNVKPTPDHFIEKMQNDARRMDAKIAYTDTHGWEKLSVDERKVAAHHGSTAAHVYRGLPCKSETHDTARAHTEVWWYGSTQEPCAMRTAYRFVNGNLVSVYTAP